MNPAHFRSLLLPALLPACLAGCLPELPPDAIDDADGDGVDVSLDCDDDDPEVGAGVPWYADADQDSYGDPDAPTDPVCPGDTVAGNYVADGTDCNDHDAAIHPSASEVCDAEDVDEDCSGLADDADAGVDVGGFTTFYADEDGDTYGDPASPILQCDPGDAVTDDQDCDDQDAAVHPGATEDDCTDPMDYNCDDSVQFEDVDGDGAAACTDCNDADAAIHPAADELCDGIDNNCADGVDEGTALDASAWYLDADSDGFGDASTSEPACTAPEGFVSSATDCDDTDATSFPSAPELCDGTDHDCDTLVNEDDSVDAPSWYPDGDTDGYGVGDPTVQCTAPAGTAPYGGDCDDGDSDYHPNASEGDCTDPNDYNCDGSTGYADVDGDSWAACVECDDTNAANFPGADEFCDGVDNNCDTVVDEPTALDAGIWYADDDSDGYGDPDVSEVSCAQPGGHVDDDSDCDDLAGDVWPGAPEYCGSVDHDCDGATDESGSVDAPSWYPDADNDTFGDGSASVVACLAPDADHVLDGTDCDDGDAAINPDAVEIEGDGIDQDCDGRDLLAEADYTTSFGGEMIIVPAGTFTMGGGAADPDGAYTDHEVTLTHDFWIGKSEITQAQWQGWAAAPTAYAACVDCPAQVSWVDAALYANALSAAEGLTECYAADGSSLDGAYVSDPYSCGGYRLPTEAEWEYASRAGEDTEYSGSSVVGDVAWYSGNSGSIAHEACTLSPNAWSLCDMSGNVWEWTNDHLSLTYGGYRDGSAQEDPPGPTTDLAADSDGNPARVVRGGDAQNASDVTRVAFRGYHPDWSRSDIVGFRLVRSVLSNSAPSGPVAVISPANPADSDDLVCVGSGSVDPEGAAVSYSYAWVVDGVDAGIATNTVPAATTQPGEAWECSVTATDGAATSPAATASVRITSDTADYTTVAGSEMIVIPAGDYLMGGGAGDPDEAYTDHQVTLTHEFWIGQTELTRDQWQQDPDNASWSYSSFVCTGTTGACPADNVSYYDVASYANWLSAQEGYDPCYTPDGMELAPAYARDPYLCPGYRLPTEAEWEYAARSGQDTAYSGSDTFSDVAWTFETALFLGTYSHEVCQLDPNAWGLCDMSGNLREWTLDGYSATDGGYGDGSSSRDPFGSTTASERVQRGGYWADDAVSARVTSRLGMSPSTSGYFVGARLARTVMPIGQDPSASGLAWSGASAGTFIGDPDADGFDDIAVTSADTTWVLSGATLASGAAADVAAAVWTCASGVSVLVSADLDGDGGEELIIGSMNANSGLGAVYAYSDPFAGGDCLTDADGAMAGDSSFFYWGFGGMAGPLDLDDDGVQDMLIGSNYEGGRVTLVPAASLLGTTTAGASATAWWSGGWSGYPYDEVGSANAVAALGDLDGDGVDDAAIGAGGEGGNLGRAYVILGDTSWIGGFDTNEASATLDPGDGGQFGLALAGPGDMNGDGYADLAVGGRNVDTTYLYAGSTLGPVAQAEVYGSGIFGWPLNTPGDLDGDGRPDLLISAIGDDTSGADAGEVWLLLGSAAWNTAASASWLGQSAGEGLQSRGRGGDSDGDGQREFLLGGYGSTPYAYLVQDPGL